MVIKKSVILFLLLFVLPISLAGASYSFEGMPFVPDAQGTLRGEFYVDGGHGLGFPPYSQSFDVPEGTVRWARLYIGVWGGTENYEGWVQPSFNGQTLEKLQLSGANDENENVYCAGHGVYWFFFDVSNLTETGENTVEILTSKGETGNKLDGRVYGAVLAAACEDSSAPLVSYKLFSGNVNLHGKGWSKSMANTNDRVGLDLNFSQNPGGIKDADLLVVYLTGTKGLPDYLEFNNVKLGTSPSYLSDMGLQEQATDVANAVSYDASGDKGVSSGYFDIERFDVLEYLQVGNNSVVFLRGLDLNGDGEIDDTEGEDYLHPVLTAMVLTSDTTPVLPDLYPEMEVDDEGLVDETPAEITFVINNPGDICEENCTVSLRVDGSEFSTAHVRMVASGVYRSAFSWPAALGEHRLEISVDSEDRIKESDEENNVCALTVSVRSKPELSVTLGDPVKIEEDEEPAAASLVFLSVLPLLVFRRKKPLVILLIVVLITGFFCGCVEQKPDIENSVYLVPVTITNNGEAPAQNFDVNLYLDGESVAVLQIPELSGQASIKEDLRATVSGGEHTLCVKVDERNYITESDEDNNEYEASYNFD